MSLIGPGSEIFVNQLPGVNSVSKPSVSSDGEKTFVFVWQASPPSEPDSDTQIYGAVYNKSSAGNSFSHVSPTSGSPDDFVSIISLGEKDNPFVAMNSRKKFVISWIDHSSFVSPGQTKFSVFDGVFESPIVEDVIVSSSLLNQTTAKIAFSDDPIDIFACAWIEESGFGIGSVKVAIYSLYDDSGPVLVPGLTYLNTFTITSGAAGNPSATELELSVNKITGEFYVAWTSTNEVDSIDKIKVQKFDRNGLIGPVFIASDPLTSALSPRLSVRPFTNEFVISWMSQDPNFTSGFVMNLFWSRMKMEDTSPSRVITTSPGFFQVPGVQAGGQGDLVCFSDGAFVLSWIDTSLTSVLATEYGWSDFPVPPTIVNAPLLASSVLPSGAISVNLSTSQFINEVRMTGLRDYVVVANTDLLLQNVTTRSVQLTHRLFVEDYLSTFAVPRIFADDTIDATANSLMQTIFLEERSLALTVNPPELRNVADLDNFLAGQDVILIGGPIDNSMSEALLDASNLILSSSVSNTEAEQIRFSLSGDGVLFGNAAPQLFIQNKNNPTGLFTLERHLNGSNIIDYAVIFQLTGSTNRLLFIAGIRDFGTAVSLYILDNVRKGTLSSVNPGILGLWTNMLNNQMAIIVKFSIPSSSNTSDTASVISGINPADITLIPVQSIKTDNP